MKKFILPANITGKYAKEVTEEEYDEMLGVVPPVRFINNAFLVGEAYDHVDEGPRYACYARIDGKYIYLGKMTTKTFDSFVIETDK